MSKKISELTNASALSGTELVEVVQSGSNRKTTTQNIANLSGGGGALSVTKIISTAEILTGFSSPVTVLAAQGAGTFIQIVSPVIYKFNFVTAAFATNTTSRLSYSVVGNTLHANTTIIGIANIRSQINPLTQIDMPQAQAENQPILWNVITGDPTAGGTSTLTIHFKYYVITI